MIIILMVPSLWRIRILKISASKPNRSPAQRVRFGKEEQRNEREMAFGAEHKKVVASDMQLATTWKRYRVLIECPPI